MEMRTLDTLVCPRPETPHSPAAHLALSAGQLLRELCLLFTHSPAPLRYEIVRPQAEVGL